MICYAKWCICLIFNNHLDRRVLETINKMTKVKRTYSIKLSQRYLVTETMLIVYWVWKLFMTNWEISFNLIITQRKDWINKYQNSNNLEDNQHKKLIRCTCGYIVDVPRRLLFSLKLILLTTDFRTVVWCWLLLTKL